MNWLTSEELAAMTNAAPAAQQEIAVQDQYTPTPASGGHKTCSNTDMQCIINRHKTASALHMVALVLFILLLLKWLSA